MKTVTIPEAEAQFPALVSEVEQGEEVLIARDGAPVARLTRVAQRKRPVPGSWRNMPGWENFKFDPSIFAPMTDEEMREEGWPVD